MKKLVDGERPLSLKEINKCIIDGSLNLECWEARLCYQDFLKWHGENIPYIQGVVNNPSNSDNKFWKDYLYGRPAVREWLVENGFLKWEDDKIVYSLDGRPGTVKLYLEESEPGVILLRAGTCILQELFAGTFRRVSCVLPAEAKIDEQGRIKEVE
jgi:hypothetical protein